MAREAEIIPFPNEEVTPPVTNIYLVMIFVCVRGTKLGIFSGVGVLKKDIAETVDNEILTQSRRIKLIDWPCIYLPEC